MSPNELRAIQAELEKRASEQEADKLEAEAEANDAQAEADRQKADAARMKESALSEAQALLKEARSLRAYEGSQGRDLQSMIARLENWKAQILRAKKVWAALVREFGEAGPPTYQLDQDLSDYKIDLLAKQGYIPKDLGGENMPFTFQGIDEYYRIGQPIKDLDRAISALEDLQS